MYPRIKKVVFDGNDGKTIFCTLFLFSCFFFKKRQCVREKIRCTFHYFWNCLNPFLSSLQSTEKTDKKKPSFFVFVQSPFWLIFSFNIFPFSSLSSLLSLFTFSFHLFVHLFLLLLSFFFSLFSPSSFFFSLSQCFSSSFFFNLMFPCIFFHRRFCVSSFGLTHFSSPLLFLISILFSSLFFLRFRILSLMSNQIQKFLFFFRRRLFFEPSLFSVFDLVFFLIASSLFLVCSMFFWFLSGSWNYFSWFSFYLYSFRVSSENCRCFWTQLSKNIIDSC